MIYPLFDPSIKPIQITDLEGNLIRVQTYGLEYYNLPNLIMEDIIEEFEEVFYLILNDMFMMNFDIHKKYFFNNEEILLKLDNEKNLVLSLCKCTNTRIKTFIDPISEETIKYKTMGMREIFNHPEIEISASIPEASGILAYAAGEVESGFVYDTLSFIEIDDDIYEFEEREDRLGEQYLVVTKMKYEKKYNTTSFGRKQLRRVK